MGPALVTPQARPARAPIGPVQAAAWPRGHGEHRDPRRSIGGCSVITRARRAGRPPSGIDGGQHPHGTVGQQRLHPGPVLGTDRSDGDRGPLRALLELTASARAEATGSSLDTLASLTHGIPAMLLARIGRMQAQTVDFATSNRNPLPLYIAGAKVLENYPLGPLMGVGAQPHVALLQRKPRLRAPRRPGRWPNRPAPHPSGARPADLVRAAGTTPD
ncbi:MAG: hypothetical protein R2705_11235 [Ilumatobacteraceae bacterium]